MSDNPTLDGKVALVTGGAGGFGRAATEILLEHGAQVALTDVDEERTQAAVDFDIVVEYGTPITQIARAVRRQVIASVEELTGLHVVEVNITVDDVNLPAVTDARDKRLQ